MSDTINNLKQIEDLFRNVTAQMLEIPLVDLEGNSINDDKIRIAWQPVGSPSWKRTDNVTFISILPIDDEFAKQRDIGYSNIDNENAKRSVNYTRIFAVGWTCYGPNSFDNIETIRNGIFLPTFTAQIKSKNMYLVTDVGMPQRAPELFNGQWWERCDLSVRYNEAVERSNTVPWMKDIKIEIRINKDLGGQVAPYASAVNLAK